MGGEVGLTRMSVRRLTPDLFPSAAGLLADAFFDNPAHVYLCPDEVVRRGQLEWLLGGNLRSQPDLARSFCLVAEGEVRAMGFWTRSDGPRAGLVAQLRAGLLRAPFRLGLVGVRRLGETTAGIDAQLARAFGGDRYWYLNNMAVHASQRGTGVGSRLLAEQLATLEGDAPRVALALSTQRERNVTFYRRLGFEVVSDEPIGTGPDAFRNWVMRREPAVRS